MILLHNASERAQSRPFFDSPKYIFGTLDHKSKQFLKTEIYALSEGWINNISIDIWFGQYL